MGVVGRANLGSQGYKWPCIIEPGLHLYEGEADGLGAEVVEEGVQGVDVGHVDDSVRDHHDTAAAVGGQQLQGQHAW